MGMTFEEAAAAHRAGDYATAERGYLAFQTSRNGVHNLAVLYRATARFAEAERLFRLILSQYPDSADDRRALSLCLLAQRRYAEAWPHYEARRSLPDLPEPVLPFPEWRDEPPAGRRLLVMREQGFGDQLMFGRYLARLQAQGAEVVVGCSPALDRLFARCGFETRSDNPAQAGADHWVLFNSLPFRMRAADPGPAVYLPPPTSRSSRGGVGVACSGNPSHRNDAHRSLDDGQAQALRTLGRDLSPAATGARDFLDTAEIVAGLELVITVDTAIAHLAGSLGVETWVLLPAIGLDWRWNDGLRSDWYPTARLFRQPTAGDWASVLTQVRRALAERS